MSRNDTFNMEYPNIIYPRHVKQGYLIAVDTYSIFPFH